MWVDKHRMVIEGKEYRLQRVIDATAEDIHHTIWKCLRHEWYDINNPINKQKIKRRTHVHLNNFFWDAQAPHLQLKKMVELREPVLGEWVRDELYAILSLPRWVFYKEELVKPKHRNKELFSNEPSKFYKDTL